MPFADVSEKFSGESNFRKTEFINLPVGISNIRILDEHPYKTYVHYVKGVYVECLGEDCPVCKNNKRIILDHPKDFREVSGYSSKVERHVINVYDKTNVKICPNCQKEHKKIGASFPSACTCNQILTAVLEQPLNKVKILAKGKDLFNQFNVLEQSVLDAKQDIIGLQNFDISLFVSGTGRDTKITAVPQTASNEVITVAPEELFDTTKVTFRLSEPEIIDLMKGVAFKDILTARKASKEDKELADLDTESLVTSEAVKSQIEGLFN